MSASLDDMPSYEHFQDELDFELKDYAKAYSISDLHIENNFIQFICFSLFLTKPSELTNEILEYFFSENPQSKTAVTAFVIYLNTSDKSYLKNKFTNLFDFIVK